MATPLEEEPHGSAARAAFTLRDGILCQEAARAELDRRLITEALGLPEMLVGYRGSIELVTRNLAHEPQIHGGKKERVGFRETIDDDGTLTVIETTEDRTGR